MAQAVIRMMASRGCWILGSGTVSMRTSPFPCQQSARIAYSFVLSGKSGNPAASGIVPDKLQSTFLVRIRRTCARRPHPCRPQRNVTRAPRCGCRGECGGNCLSSAPAAGLALDADNAGAEHDAVELHRGMIVGRVNVLHHLARKGALFGCDPGADGVEIPHSFRAGRQRVGRGPKLLAVGGSRATINSGNPRRSTAGAQSRQGHGVTVSNQNPSTASSAEKYTSTRTKRGSQSNVNHMNSSRKSISGAVSFSRENRISK